MPEPVVEIPNRPAFRAAEVCEIAQIPAYVLKSWEKEFPGLGVASKPGGPRVYRRTDVEQVLKIKQLLFNEGLTLAGVRRKLEGEPKLDEEPLLPEMAPPVAGEVREKVARVKQELRSLLDLLSAPRRARETKARDTGESGPLQPGAAPAEMGSAHDADAIETPPSPQPDFAEPASRPEAVAAAEPALPLLEDDQGEAPAKPVRRARRGTRS